MGYYAAVPKTLIDQSNADALHVHGTAGLEAASVTGEKLADGAIEGDATPKLGGNLDVSDKTITTSAANGKIVLAPNGTGAIQADGSGDARGQYAIDLQRVRSTANQVPSGNYGVVCGGQNNRISAGTHGAIVGGSANLVNQNYAISGGQSSSAQGTAAVSFGSSNLVSGSYAACPGGLANTVSGYAAFGIGYAAEAKLRGQIAHSSGLFASVGDAQHTRCIMLRAVSAGATGDALILTLDGAAPGSANRRTVDANHFTGVRIHLTGVSTDGTEAVSWIYHAAIKRDAGNNTALVGTPSKMSEMKTATLGVGDPTISADDTNEALQIAVAAHATLNFRWVAVLKANEVQYA